MLLLRADIFKTFGDSIVFRSFIANFRIIDNKLIKSHTTAEPNDTYLKLIISTIKYLKT